MNVTLGELPFGAEQVPAIAPATPESPPATQYLSFICDRCRRHVGRVTSHYVVLVCVCGKEYWALRPKGNGPLVAFPWPGTLLERPTA